MNSQPKGWSEADLYDYWAWYGAGTYNSSAHIENLEEYLLSNGYTMMELWDSNRAPLVCARAFTTLVDVGVFSSRKACELWIDWWKEEMRPKNGA